MSRETIAMRAAKELFDGAVVNLGIGIPTLVSSFIPEGMEVTFHSENGVLAFGPVVTARRGRRKSGHRPGECRGTICQTDCRA